MTSTTDSSNDGGKGVVVVDTLPEAEEVATKLRERQWGEVTVEKLA